MTTALDFKELMDRLETGDIELLFHDSRSIKAHVLKLKFASWGGFLHNLIEDLFDDQIDSAKRRRTEVGKQVGSGAAYPQIKVGLL